MVEISSANLRPLQRLPTRLAELVIQRHFIDPLACAALITIIDRQRRPSTLADDFGDARFRTSETCELSNSDPVVATVDAAIAGLVGIDASFGEPLQGQRYAVGQEFKLHTDYFEPTGKDFETYCAIAGQRTWTAMIYLNEPAAGGATRFKTLDKTIQPETGKLVAWNNLLPGGRPNPATLHQGMKVRAGTKYILTKWFRQRPWPTC